MSTRAWLVLLLTPLVLCLAGCPATPEVEDVGEGLQVRRHGDYVILMDALGNELVEDFTYDSIDRFSCGRALCANGGSYGFLDKTGKEVIPRNYTAAHRFVDGAAWCRLPNSADGLSWQLLDVDGKVLFEGPQANNASPAVDFHDFGQVFHMPDRSPVFKGPEMIWSDSEQLLPEPEHGALGGWLLWSTDGEAVLQLDDGRRYDELEPLSIGMWAGQIEGSLAILDPQTRRARFNMPGGQVLDYGSPTNLSAVHDEDGWAVLGAGGDFLTDAYPDADAAIAAAFHVRLANLKALEIDSMEIRSDLTLREAEPFAGHLAALLAMLDEGPAWRSRELLDQSARELCDLACKRLGASGYAYFVATYPGLQNAENWAKRPTDQEMQLSVYQELMLRIRPRHDIEQEIEAAEQIGPATERASALEALFKKYAATALPDCAEDYLDMVVFSEAVLKRQLQSLPIELFYDVYDRAPTVQSTLSRIGMTASQLDELKRVKAGLVQQWNARVARNQRTGETPTWTGHGTYMFGWEGTDLEWLFPAITSDNQRILVDCAGNDHSVKSLVERCQAAADATRTEPARPGPWQQLASLGRLLEAEGVRVGPKLLGAAEAVSATVTTLPASLREQLMTASEKRLSQWLNQSGVSYPDVQFAKAHLTMADFVLHKSRKGAEAAWEETRHWLDCAKFWVDFDVIQAVHARFAELVPDGEHVPYVNPGPSGPARVRLHERNTYDVNTTASDWEAKRTAEQDRAEWERNSRDPTYTPSSYWRK